MILEMNNAKAGTKPNYTRKTKQLLSLSLTLFAADISCVKVHFFAINGPKGGHRHTLPNFDKIKNIRTTCCFRRRGSLLQGTAHLPGQICTLQQERNRQEAALPHPQKKMNCWLPVSKAAWSSVVNFT